MFFTVATLLFFITCAVAQLPPGRYHISSRQHGNTPVRAESDGITNVRIPDPPLPASPADTWDINPVNQGSGFTVQTNNSRYAGVENPAPGQLVKTLSEPTAFDIQPAGNGQFQIKLLNNDLLWTAAAYDNNSQAYPVIIAPADGTNAQKWLLFSIG